MTTSPNSLVGPKHPKAMPVILAQEDHERWLRGDMSDALALAAAYPAERMAIE